MYIFLMIKFARFKKEHVFQGVQQVVFGLLAVLGLPMIVCVPLVLCFVPTACNLQIKGNGYAFFYICK